MKRIKNWLIHSFLPVWAREAMLAENQKLREENQKLRERLAQHSAYIDGLEAGIRAQRRIVINTGMQEGKK